MIPAGVGQKKTTLKHRFEAAMCMRSALNITLESSQSRAANMLFGAVPES
jgi:hypothetical protein